MRREVCYNPISKLYYFAETDCQLAICRRGKVYKNELPPHVAAAARGAKGQYVDWPVIPEQPPPILAPQPWRCWELVVVGLGVVGVLLIWFATYGLAMWASLP